MVDGEPVPETRATIAPDDDHQLVVTLPADLPAGGYTVAWRNLSAADGHTLEGFFGFSVGATAADGVATMGVASASSRPAQALSRGLALLGLAMLLAIAPVTLAVLAPAGRAVDGLADRLWAILRRYAVVATVFAMLASLAALAAQAVTIAPDLAVLAAIAETLTGTRYGRLWIARILLLGCCAAAVLGALWTRLVWRRGLLFVATLLALVAPLPFSLLSHAAAQTEGARAAVAADALHLLAATIWGGGLFLLAAVLVPALRPFPVSSWREALRVAFPRFTALALAAWSVLLLSGLYSAWLQVGTIAALRETPYGQTLLLKGALLLPILVLAALHLILGRRGVAGQSARRVAVTVTLEAFLAVAVLLVVGRLIGLEPARAVLASRTPTELALPLRFDTKEGPRAATLALSPGAPGSNTFTLDVAGGPLPTGAEGVLRFALPAQAIGAQELRLPRTAPNRFAAAGSELSLAGAWQIEAIVREIGAFSWSTDTTLVLTPAPPPPPERNPAPRFGPAGAVGMLLLAAGMMGLVVAVVWRGAALTRRGGLTIASVAVFALGGMALVGARLPSAGSAPVLAQPEPAIASPASASPTIAHHHEMASSHPSPVASLPEIGTPVRQDGLSVTVTADPVPTAPATVTVEVVDSQGAPVPDARVVVFAQMMGMSHRTEETPAPEVAPGRYRAENLFLTMTGSWQLTARVSPKGEATRVFRFVVDVP
jgi:copper transport protein